MSKIEDLRKRDSEQVSYTVQTVEALSGLIDELHNTGRVKGVGFDVFGTALISLYTRLQQTDFLSRKIYDYLKSQSDTQITVGDCLRQYNELRESIKDRRMQLDVDIPAKQQELPESQVLEAFGEQYSLNDVKGFIDYVQNQWLRFDLQNTQPIDGVPNVIEKSVELFGRERVGFYTNNSCSKHHLLSLLQANGYLGGNNVSGENVCISSEFGFEKYGYGLRKPNILAFRDFSAQLELDPKDVAFIGDGGNDVLFATGSNGVGIRLFQP
jgi:FMN phosphatase YigB (HAD superfamily)